MLLTRKCRPFWFGLLPACLLAFLLIGCSGDNPPPTGSDSSALVASAVTHTDCKVFAAENSASIWVPVPSCIVFAYDGSDNLHIERINAAFNCCPDSLYVECDLAGHVITITEKEDLTSGGCDCLCLFDLDYSLSGIEPGEYTIKIVEPYHPANEQNPLLQITVDLTVTPSGSFCVDREGYPWGMGSELEATVTSLSECQVLPDESSRAPWQVDECIVYAYDSASISVFNVEHVNAVFNCCADSAAVTVSVARDTIFIQEHEYFVHQGPCHCICPYDLSYEIRNLMPGQYTVQVVGPHAEDMGDTLTFEIDLLTSEDGSYCVAGPW